MKQSDLESFQAALRSMETRHRAAAQSAIDTEIDIVRRVNDDKAIDWGDTQFNRGRISALKRIRMIFDQAEG